MNLIQTGNKTRDAGIDIAKGIAILSIVAGHLGVGWINSIVFTFHVPLFFILSGYFFKDREGVIKKYAQRLLVPYIFVVAVLALVAFAKNVAKAIVSNSTINVYDTVFKWIVASIYGSGSRNDFFSFSLPQLVQFGFSLRYSV